MAFISKKVPVSEKKPLLGGEASLMKLKSGLKGFSGFRRDSVLGGEASLAKIREGFKKPKVEEKKDPSAFQGKPYLQRDTIRRWLKRDEAWKITKVSANERPKLEKKLFDPKDNPKRFGLYIDKREANLVLKDFESFPNRAKARYGMKNRSETIRMRNLLRKFVGK